VTVTESTRQVKAGIAAAVDAVLAADATGGEVAVFWGEPPPVFPREFICIMGAQVTIDAATMGPQRSRDETIRVALNIVAHRQGPTAQEDSAARAYDLAGAIEKQVRTVDPTLGVPGCRWCFMTRLEESGGTPIADRAAGRYTELIVEFTALVRVTE
jgi:hypothetical protein